MFNMLVREVGITDSNFVPKASFFLKLLFTNCTSIGTGKRAYSYTCDDAYVTLTSKACVNISMTAQFSIEC